MSEQGEACRAYRAADVGQSRLSHSAPVRTNIRYASHSDRVTALHRKVAMDQQRTIARTRSYVANAGLIEIASSGSIQSSLVT